jgi:hypothetical protein
VLILKFEIGDRELIVNERKEKNEALNTHWKAGKITNSETIGEKKAPLKHQNTSHVQTQNSGARFSL